MRLSEIPCRGREHVYLDQGVVRLQRAKGGARTELLSETARKLLQGQLESHASE
jgi:hypothetical protein